MFRSTQARFALTIVFALAAVSLATASARAFSQDSGGPSGSENSTFSDPVEQVNIFGRGAEPQSFGSNGSVQFDPQQQGQLNALKHLQNQLPHFAARPALSSWQLKRHCANGPQGGLDTCLTH
jgi:hypothetical protein